MSSLIPSSSERGDRIWICVWRKPGFGKRGRFGKEAQPIFGLLARPRVPPSEN
jgi:hypothetical protein